eukprot:764443-Hanusia_phi.AAC.11
MAALSGRCERAEEELREKVASLEACTRDSHVLELRLQDAWDEIDKLKVGNASQIARLNFFCTSQEKLSQSETHVEHVNFVPPRYLSKSLLLTASGGRAEDSDLSELHACKRGEKDIARIFDLMGP